MTQRQPDDVMIRNYGTQVRTDDSLWVADSTNLFLGNTRQYIFLYNRSKKLSYVYPMQKVREIIFNP
jgi:hypothetical protein